MFHDGPGAPATTVVFTHPNHEIAVFGLLQRLREKLQIIYLTDGGGEARLAETRAGLGQIGLLDKAVFLSHSEQSFYDGILNGDAGFFRGVVMQVRSQIEAHKPGQILCDGVEYYNSAHDIGLPVVLAAGGGERVFEIPLVYQKNLFHEAYGVQSAPEGVAIIERDLSASETSSKKKALAEAYGIIRSTMGPVLEGAPEAFTMETLILQRSPLRMPEPGYVIRYDRRAAALKAAGQIKHEITWAAHYMPLARELLK